MKLIFLKMTLFFTLMMATMTSAFAESGSMLPEKFDQYTIWIGLAVVIWEYLLANNKNVKSNSSIDLLVSGAKKFFGLDRYSKK